MAVGEGGQSSLGVTYHNWPDRSRSLRSEGIAHMWMVGVDDAAANQPAALIVRMSRRRDVQRLQRIGWLSHVRSFATVKCRNVCTVYLKHANNKRLYGYRRPATVVVEIELLVSAESMDYKERYRKNIYIIYIVYFSVKEI